MNEVNILILNLFLKDILRDDQKDFEKNRIKVLQQERVDVQKKTFTKWCNALLSKVTPSHYQSLIMNFIIDLTTFYSPEWKYTIYLKI